MPCVGNDVVDLKKPANTGKSQDSRFLKKILTDAEIEYVKNAENPDTALWSLWACKETAYKIIKKTSPDIAFVPRRWRVVFKVFQSEYAEGEVVIKERDEVFIRLFCETQISKTKCIEICKSSNPAISGGYNTPPIGAELGSMACPGVHTRDSDSQYIHCIGSDDIAILDDIIWRVDTLPEKETDPSVFSRYCLAHNLASHFSLDFHQISIKRTETNGELEPPRVYVGGRKTDIDVSLSHDGRFIAYAFLNETHCPASLRSWNTTDIFDILRL
ncbi:MAG: 4'-phosphopantetheinyl transferase superfamily protein [Smithella sp.]